MKKANLRAWFIWILIVAFTMMLYVIQTGYAVFNISLQDSLNLSIEQIGFAAAVYPCTAAVLQLFTGALLDELGPRKTILPSILIAVLGVIIISNASSYSQILLAQFAFGCATCFAFVGCGYLIGKWFPSEKFGQVFGFAQVVLAISAAFGQVTFSNLLEIISWREIFKYFSFMGLFLYLLAYKYVDLPNGCDRSSKVDLKIFSNVLKSNVYVVKEKMVLLSAIYGGIIYGYLWAFGTLWLPKILIKKGLEISVANYSVSCLWLGLALGSIFVDRIWRSIGSTKLTLRLVIVVQGILLYLMAFGRLNPVIAMLLSFMFGITTSSHMLTYTIAKKTVGASYSGSAISIVNASMFLIGGIFVALIGYIIGMTKETLADYQNVILWFSLAIVIGYIVTNFMNDEISMEEAVYE